ncbi:MAG: 2-hydroxychromene-2-carboxylate isomerase [Hyphomonadaceae bacterium]|nr:2-hydroxychromene-2-carboxylate isomerase [Hyphomonadaceae bacterium]
MVVDFIFDVGSPNAYLAHKVLPQITARTDARFRIVPALLGGIFKLTGNQAPMLAFGGIRNKMPYEMLETRRFIRDHNLDAFQMNPHFPVNTLLMMRAAAGAEIDGVLDPYIDAILHHMWEAPKKMDDPAIVHAALTESGLDADRLLARAQEADAKATLLSNTEAAVERGAFGIPTFFVGDEMFFGKNTLRDVEAEILRQRG